MRRIQFIELHEQPWFPAFLRNDVADVLQYGLGLWKVYGPVMPLLQRVLESIGSHSIVDLCSGAGGPWSELAPMLQREIGRIRVSLTDKYPYSGASKKAESIPERAIDFHEDPIDARNVPSDLNGFRTMFTSFHHFPPTETRAIFQSALDAGEGIGIFEITQRTPSALFLIPIWSLALFFFAPFVRPFRWSRLFFTYVIPIIPLVMLFDGVVSCLRSYHPEELRKMVEQLSRPEYQWQTGKLRNSNFRPSITYLIGCPRRPLPVILPTVVEDRTALIAEKSIRL
jgi:hypothetical protein